MGAEKEMSQTVTKKKRFEIDDEGFRNQISESPLWRQFQEMISNAFDEKTVNYIEVTVGGNESEVMFSITDNGDGFKDYRDIYTLYKDSYKRVNPEQRGRFNLGEKQFFAIAKRGVIKTRKIMVEFDDSGRTETEIPKHKGTTITAWFDGRSDESVDSIIDNLRLLIVPEDKVLDINEERIPHKEPVAFFKAVLPTVKSADKNQRLVLIKRETVVSLYKKEPEDEPIIYEMGVPIQELKENMKWHIDIEQKVPQVTERNVVSDAYLQTLYAEIAKNTLELMNGDDAGSVWGTQAMKRVDSETGGRMLEKIYGTDMVAIESTTDHRANEKAMEAGYKLIQGRSLDPIVRKHLTKDTENIIYAGKRFETTFADSESVEPNADMIVFAGIVERMGKDITGRTIKAEFFKMKNGSDSATMCGNVMSFNVSNLGKSFFKSFGERQIGLVAHELAHAIDASDCGQYSHLKMEYIRALEKVAGKIGMKGIEHWRDGHV